jgi:LmbE family N-acetylglucosaminyl deacetylase
MDLRRIFHNPRESARYYLDLARFGDRPMRLSEPVPAQRVVVLAPHPDDEAIGCGGAIRLYTKTGAAVSVIYISDGSAGDGSIKKLKGQDRLDAQMRLVETRKLEATSAAAALGVTDLAFLGLPDGGVSASPENVARLRAHLERLKPELVFLPFFIDQHPDHVATNVLFLEAAAGLPGREPRECWGYEVWTPLYANRILDISSVAETKWEALRQYESQNSRLDYLGSIQGLNTFRQRTAYKSSGFAEAFFAASLADYRTLCLERPGP